MHSGREVVLDLIARRPTEFENVKVSPPRVGSGSKTGLHGRLTPEAFAVEINPTTIPVTGITSTGEPTQFQVSVPHPYASLNMKVRAAYDWLRMTRDEIPAKPFSEKHAFDVFLLVAMLTEEEIASSLPVANQFKDLPIAHEIKAEAKELFAEPTSPGFLEATRQAKDRLDHGTFWEALSFILGIELSS